MTARTNTGSSGVYEELTASFFQTGRTEIIIDCSAQDVWSVLTDLNYPNMKSWNPDVVTVKHISGEFGRENEFVLVTKTGQSPFFMRTIRIVPYQQRVLRIDAVDRSAFAFVDHSLYGLEGGKTRVVYNGYIETCGVLAEQVKMFDFNKAAEGLMNYLNHIHKLLKDVVEEKSSANAAR